MNHNITDFDHSDDSKLEGLRMTRQRREVYDVLMSLRDHPTASEVYERAKANMPGISLATVYNCLEALVDHGAVRQVHFERESSRYCPNLTAHGHFQDEQSGTVIDVPLKKGASLGDFLDLPAGVQVNNIEINLTGKISN
ncbi:MAG: transcriptional repressor [Akkermansiaceae bacterium]|nr:transcriptional repressor [Akkermansiaceae bacterium]